MEWIIQNQFYLLLGLMIIGFAALSWFVFDLTKKVAVLFGGPEADAGNLQLELVRRLAKAETKLEEFGPRIDLLEKISKISVQKVGFLRFNPFQDTGGDQSFILALLDRENNGVILTSLYAREGMRIYAKNVEKGRSKHPLSEEEKRVLEETIHK